MTHLSYHRHNPGELDFSRKTGSEKCVVRSMRKIFMTLGLWGGAVNLDTQNIKPMGKDSSVNA